MYHVTMKCFFFLELEFNKLKFENEGASPWRTARPELLALHCSANLL